MTKNIFDKLREMSGGRLTQQQVNAANKIMDATGTGLLTALLGIAERAEMNLSSKGQSLIAAFEGTRLEAYDDGGGVWTIGIGTTVYPDGRSVKRGDKATLNEVMEYFRRDVEHFERAVDKAVEVPLSQNQFDALVSLVYNIGISGFSKSTLLKKLNAGDYTGAADQFLRWNKDGGRVITGLKRRREAERAVFLKK